MIHSSVKSLEEAVSRAGLSAKKTSLSEPDRKTLMSGSMVDDLIYTAVFSSDDATRKRARALIHQLARRTGAVSMSIQTLYEAIGQSEVTGKFTVPAHNIRALTYDVSRALFRAAMARNVGAFIFEIARSEIGYTEQRPAEYAACVLAAAIKEGFQGPVFLQGDHFQASAKKWKTDRDGEIRAIEALIDEALAAEFYNIDIDTSTLVDLSFDSVDQQQRENYEAAAHFSRYIRKRQLVEVSIGGEIGEVGKDNSTPEEFRAYMGGYLRSLGEGLKGISKISVQTGTSHGGVPMADGTIAKANIDFNVLREISAIGRREYGLGGAVQHGASTLPEEVFDQFPKNDTLEIHLATGFQNMILDHPSFPREMKQAIGEFCVKNCADERKKGESEEQFFYKSRKKALGPFKRAMWDMPASSKQPIIAELERKFAFLFEKLAVVGTKDVVRKHVDISDTTLPTYAAVSDERAAMALVDPNEGE